MALRNCELHARNDDDDTCCFTTWFCHFKTHLLKVPYDEVLVRLPAAVLETNLLLLIVAVSLLIMPLPQSGALREGAVLLCSYTNYADYLFACPSPTRTCRAMA